MKHNRLFWHLVRFHTQLAPWWMLPIMCVILISFSLIGAIGHNGNDVFQYDFHSRENLVVFIYFYMLAAQLTWGMRWGRNMAQNQPWTTGSYAYLFTRAVHRPTLYWAKLAVFLVICFLPILPTLGWTLKSPDIRIQLQGSRQNEKTLAFQKSFPELKIQESNSKNNGPVITLSGGNWNWCFFRVTQILLISLSVAWLCALSWRWPKIWILAVTLFIFAVFAPVLMIMVRPKTTVINLFSDDEKILIWTHGHQGLIIVALAVFATLVFWDSYRRFLKLPQYKGAML